MEKNNDEKVKIFLRQGEENNSEQPFCLVPVKPRRRIQKEDVT